MLQGCAPAPPLPLEKQLTALLIPHSWITGRVCVILSKEIEIKKGRKGENKRRKGIAQKFILDLCAYTAVMRTVY